METKRILDSVHGTINVDKKYFTTIIDTRAFQRLRRIEQTSVRSVFPSARHDRFIHSIGVFHIGSLMAQQLLEEAQSNEFYGIKEDMFRQIIESYKIACLLHDIGHSPYSHTFERYFGNKQDLANELCKLRPTIKNDLSKKIFTPNEHEYVSAYIVIKDFSQQVLQLGGDVELVARMIIGCKYLNTDDISAIKNCFISLLNGCVVDADRLDYACRDVWASGYATSSIDVTRLISAIHIHKEGTKDQYCVCFGSNVLNEIESVINVKDFQVNYVLNHHTVIYEQHLLTHAVEQMAKKVTRLKVSQLATPALDTEKGTSALSKILTIDALRKKGTQIILPSKKSLTIRYITDDDLMFLTKLYGDQYYEEWASRNYSKFALWKTRDEFYYYFPCFKRGNKFDTDVKKCIYRALKNDFNRQDIWLIPAYYKPKASLNDVKILIQNHVVSYTDLYRTPQYAADGDFYYLYLPKPKSYTEETLKKYKDVLLKKIREEFEYSPKPLWIEFCRKLHNFLHNMFLI